MPRAESSRAGEPHCGSHCHDRTAAPPLSIALPLRHCLFNRPHSAQASPKSGAPGRGTSSTTTILGRFQASLPYSSDIFCVLNPSAQTHTVAPHCDSHCHRLRVFLTRHILLSAGPARAARAGPSFPPESTLEYPFAWRKGGAKRGTRVRASRYWDSLVFGRLAMEFAHVRGGYSSTKMLVLVQASARTGGCPRCRGWTRRTARAARSVLAKILG